MSATEPIADEARRPLPFGPGEFERRLRAGREGARRVGRDAASIDVSLFLFCSVGPDRQECLDDCRMASALIVSRVPDYARPMGYDPTLVKDVREAWKRTSSAAAAGRLVPDQWVEDLTLTIVPRGHAEGGRPRLETVRAVTEHVIPRFR
jgi:alkanesulfonate monooxygenase SsuD/methylene tetrahydromethanopterin reductase-like flavin-dependent oxidoreductase (luciferase family)